MRDEDVRGRGNISVDSREGGTEACGMPGESDGEKAWGKGAHEHDHACLEALSLLFWAIFASAITRLT